MMKIIPAIKRKNKKSPGVNVLDFSVYVFHSELFSMLLFEDK